jgi:hypothetical protein
MAPCDSFKYEPSGEATGREEWRENIKEVI